jgi:hypothetical protein
MFLFLHLAGFPRLERIILMTLTRLLNDPHAVLREAGVKIPEDTTLNTVVIGPGASATPTSVVVVKRGKGWVAIIIENGMVVETVPLGPVSET